MGRIDILVISLAIAVSFSGCQKDEIALDVLDELDYEIYSLILDERFPNNDEFTIKQETTPWVEIRNSTFEYLNSIADVDTSAFIDYFSKNETIHYLDSNRFKIAGKVVTLISPEEMNILNPEDQSRWSKFYDKYPDSNG